MEDSVLGPTPTGDERNDTAIVHTGWLWDTQRSYQRNLFENKESLTLCLVWNIQTDTVLQLFYLSKCWYTRDHLTFCQSLSPLLTFRHSKWMKRRCKEGQRITFWHFLFCDFTNEHTVNTDRIDIEHDLRCLWEHTESYISYLIIITLQYSDPRFKPALDVT